MVFFKNVCDISFVLKIIMFADKILGVVLFVIPMLLIVMVTVDLARNVVSNEEEMKKNINTAIKRIVMAVFLFLMPTFIGVFGSIVEDTTISNCLKNANLTYIKDMELEEAAERATRDSSVVKSSVDLSSNRKLIVTEAKYSFFGGKIPEGDEYYPLDGKDENGKTLNFLEIDGKFLKDSEQKEIRSLLKKQLSQVKIGIIGWHLQHGL